MIKKIGALCLALGLIAPLGFVQDPDLIEERNLRVAMRDGITLATDVLRRKSPERSPVILVRTPYNRLLEPSKHQVRFFAQAGYAVVVQDVRGRYDSEGEWVPFFNEAADGYDAQEWTTRQSWSNGKVITYGASYLSLVQWLAATQGSSSLRGMVSNVGPEDIYHGLAYVGGAFQHATGITWSALMEGRATTFMPDVSVWTKAFRHLPVSEAVTSAGRDPGFFRDWVGHPTYDAYWRKVRWRPDYAKFNFPVFNIGGWYDLFQKGAAENFRRHREEGPTSVQKGHRLIIGPWAHGPAATTRPRQVQGAVDFGAASAIDLRESIGRWLDHFMRGAENGAERDAPVKVFTMGENAWHEYQNWPVEGTKYVNYYLGGGGSANSASGDGRLSTSKPKAAERSDRYAYDPSDPAPTVGGGNCCFPQVVPWGPMDQREVEKRKDVLVYTTSPLTGGVRTTGPVTAKLWVKSSVPDTDFTVKLVDVHPDGLPINLTDGILRARYRKSFERSELMRPGRPYELTIDLGITSNFFKPGHRIRVEVSSSNFPKYARNTNTGNQPEVDTTWKVARQEILHDAQHPSRVILPALAP